MSIVDFRNDYLANLFLKTETNAQTFSAFKRKLHVEHR